ncbi:MAG: MFS transporter [Candidatus Latescibacterota bacterium]|nr:MFS transporter [Candidatus Latescibacterota bacterium]
MLTGADRSKTESSATRTFLAFIGFESLWGTGFSLAFHGPILTGFVIAAGGSITAVGGLAAVGSAVSILLQPVSAMLFGRSRHRRYIAVTLQWSVAASLLVPVAVYYGLSADYFATWAVYAVAATVTLQSIFGSLNSPVFYSLTIDTAPVSQRGLLQGVRQVCLAFSGVFAAVLARDLLIGSTGPDRYVDVFVVALGFCLVGPLFILMLREPEIASQTGVRGWPFLRRSFTRLAGQSGFWRLMIGLALIHATLAVGNLIPALLRQDSGVDITVADILLFTTVARVAAGPLVGYWVGRHGYRFGAEVAIAASVAGWLAVILLPLGWATIFWGLMSGLALVTTDLWNTNLIAQVFPTENRVSLLAAAGFVMGPVGVVAPLIWAILMDGAIEFHHPLGTARIILIIAAAMAGVTWLYIRRFVPNPKPAEIQ